MQQQWTTTFSWAGGFDISWHTSLCFTLYFCVAHQKAKRSQLKHVSWWRPALKHGQEWRPHLGMTSYPKILLLCGLLVTDSAVYHQSVLSNFISYWNLHAAVLSYWQISHLHLLSLFLEPDRQRYGLMITKSLTQLAKIGHESWPGPHSVHISRSLTWMVKDNPKVSSSRTRPRPAGPLTASLCISAAEVRLCGCSAHGAGALGCLVAVITQS